MDNVKRPKLVVISGPTASGKSDLAIKLARKINGEIISSDSRQVYKGMDIGTGKVTKKERRLVRHHLLNVVSPKKKFSADDFKKIGRTVVDDIFRRNKIPIICGGTGFFTDMLVFDFPIPSVPPDWKLRRRLDKLGTEHLFKMLRKLDPRRADTIDPNNPRRLIRAIEIVLSSGKPSPEISTDYTKRQSPYEILWLGINPGKERLAVKIRKRLDIRLKQGMMNEVKKLHESGVSWKRLESFGLEYRWIARYLGQRLNVNGQLSKEMMKSFLLRDIIRYSARQMTWFKRNKNIRWVHSSTEAGVLVKNFLAR